MLWLLGCSLLSEPAPPPAPPPPPTLAPLKGRVTADAERLTLFNDGDTEWTNVIATANNALICNIGLVHPGDQAGINLSNCSGGPLASPVVMVRVAATQGYFETAVGDAAQAPGDAAQAAEAASSVRPQATMPPPPRAKPSVVTDSTTVTLQQPASPTQPAAMSLSATMSGGIGPARRLTINNNSTFAWTNCSVVANDLYTYNLAMLPAGDKNGVMMIKFKDQAGNLFTSGQQVNKVKVSCDQGTATAQPT